MVKKAPYGYKNNQVYLNCPRSVTGTRSSHSARRDLAAGGIDKKKKMPAGPSHRLCGAAGHGQGTKLAACVALPAAYGGALEPRGRRFSASEGQPSCPLMEQMAQDLHEGELAAK